ncbi:MAG: histidine phosphatase family protein [Rubrivivax sp.]|nr:histidine phosphatase family protein [Rubrivivax sp.]
MTELLFIRHGETDWNRQQRFQGQIDVPLNPAGHAQAQRLAQRLAEEPHEALFSSDLRRARETAAPLAAAWKMAAPVALAGFREQSFGVLEGLDVPTIKSRHPELWLQWLEHRADFTLPGGESLRQFHARVFAAVGDLVTAFPGQRLAVVTHGGVLDMLWRTAHGLPLDGLRVCEIPNTGLNRLRWAGGTLQVEQWADADHLVGLPGQASTRAGER